MTGNELTKAFLKSGVGWIAPDGTILPCPSYGHFSVLAEYLKDNQEFQRMYSAGLEEVEDCERDCQEYADRGEHPEWHNAEMAQSSFEHKVMDWAYARGFIRVGICRDVLHADGKWDNFTGNQSVVRKFADDLGCYHFGRKIEVKYNRR